MLTSIVLTQAGITDASHFNTLSLINLSRVSLKQQIVVPHSIVDNDEHENTETLSVLKSM